MSESPNWGQIDLNFDFLVRLMDAHSRFDHFTSSGCLREVSCGGLHGWSLGSIDIVTSRVP